MSNLRRTLAVLVTVLLVAGAFASPVLAQTTLEDSRPYPISPPPDAEGPDDDNEVGGVLVEAEDVISEPKGEEQAQATATVLGVTLQRTGANTLLIAVIGLVVLGLGGFLVARTRRSAPEA